MGSRERLRPGDRLGDFVIRARLGRGGMGEVWAAEQAGLGRDVALKLITGDLADSAEFRARFEREARALALLDSPHVVTVHTSGEVDGHLFLATQLVPGGDLGTLLARDGALPAAQALTVVEQVARGLADVHRIGLVHRDIKPSNVLLDGRDAHHGHGWHALLSDFGVVRSLTPAASDITLTGAAVGTPAYMAPEVHLGEPADEASDVYAVGCLLWAALSGGAPYVGRSQYAVVHAHLHEPVPQLDGTGYREVNAVLRRALAKDGTERPSAAELAEQLAAVRAGLRADAAERVARVPAALAPPPPTAVADRSPGSPGSPRSPRPTSPPPRPRTPNPTGARRRGRLVVAGAVAVVLAVALGVVLLRGQADDGTDDAEPDDGSDPAQVDEPQRGAGSLTDDAGEIRDVATTFVDTLNTYGPDLLAADGTMPQWREQVLSLTTPEFATQFEGTVKAAEQVVAQAGYHRTYQGFDVGLVRLDDDSAVVLVGGATDNEYVSRDGKHTTAPFEAVRVVVDLVRAEDAEGGWLVDDYQQAAAGGGLSSEPDRQEDFVHDAVDAAVAAVPDVLGYDYRTLADDLAAAQARMTPSQAREFVDYADTKLRDQAPASRTSVSATAVAAGAGSVQAARVEVLVFVDLTYTSADDPARVDGDVFRLMMQRTDGGWLLDGYEYERITR